MNIRIGEFIGSFTVLHHDERSKIAAIDQDGTIKRYSSSQIRPFVAQPSELDDAKADRKIEDCHTKANPTEDEPTHDEKIVQLNFYSQPYGEQSATDDSDNMQKKHNKAIAKAREILMQTEEIMDNKPSNPRKDVAASTNNPSRCASRQQSHTA